MSAEIAVVGRLLLGDELVTGMVIISGDRIAEVRRGATFDRLPGDVLEAAIVAPGLIDLQVNGGFGVEVGPDPASIRRLAARLPETGVTAFLPTVVSGPAADYPPIVAAFAAARSTAGARPLGLHLEGPFLAPQRPGAHRRAVIEAADDALFDLLLGAKGVRVVTLAPERPGAHARIRRLRERGIIVSLGHTDATAEEFVTGVDLGARMATHLFNAMSPFSHRAPGAIGAALTEPRITVGLIADGVHSHPLSLRLAVAAKGPERIALVSDMMAAAGMGPGSYTLAGQAVRVDASSARLADGTLAGSILTMDQAVRNMVAWTGNSPATALRMASEVPARVLGLSEFGRIVAGAFADLVLLDETLAPTATIVAGRIVWRRAAPPPRSHVGRHAST